MAFSALFVCTGNICRSPVAELLFRHRVAGPDISAASAGTSGLAGHGMDAPTALALRREYGIDPSGHVARRLRPELVDDADLVLTADVDHRAAIVRSDPLVFRKTFTLREFARLGAQLPSPAGPVDADGLRARVAAVAAQRGWVEAPAPGGDDVPDPFGAGYDVALVTVRAVATAVDGVIAALGFPAGAVRSGEPARD